MPDTRPGRGKYVIATKAVLHGAACVEKKFAGISIKQVTAPAGTGLGSVLISTVQVGERFFISTKGAVVIANPGAMFAEGDPVYIRESDNVLQSASGGGIVKFGRASDIAPTQGVPTGFMRVDLDARDSF